jgi:hypothetical protein
VKCSKHQVSHCAACAAAPFTVWLSDPPSYPDDNPKTAVGATKVPLHLIPPAAKHMLAEAMANGAEKYGPYNWREKRVSMTVYIAAALRHIDALLDGEDVALDSGVHHGAHAMACMAIILDAMTIGKLNDDRPAKGASPRMQAEFAARVSPAKALDMVCMDPPPLACTHERRMWMTGTGWRCVLCGESLEPKNPPATATGD